jgi:hypothetical protein
MLRLFVAISVFALVYCSHAPKEAMMEVDKTSPESPINRGVASRAAPSDFEPQRYHFDGSGEKIIQEFRLMRGNLEAGQPMELSHARDALLYKNLYDTGVDPAPNLDCKVHMAMGRDDFLLHHRTPDGNCYMHKLGPFMKQPP